MPTDPSTQTGSSEQGAPASAASSEQAAWSDAGEQTPEQVAERTAAQRLQEAVAKAKQDALSEAGKKSAEQRNRDAQRIRDLQGQLEETKAQLAALSTETDAALAAYVQAEELPKVKDQIKLRMTASQAEVYKRSAAQAQRDAIVRATLEHEGIPEDHPGLNPAAWVSQEAFERNIAFVKKQVEQDKALSELNDLKAKIALLEGKGKAPATEQTPNRDGAGVGLMGQPPSGQGRDWRKASDADYKLEYRRLRQASGYVD